MTSGSPTPPGGSSRQIALDNRVSLALASFGLLASELALYAPGLVFIRRNPLRVPASA